MEYLYKRWSGTQDTAHWGGAAVRNPAGETHALQTALATASGQQCHEVRSRSPVCGAGDGGALLMTISRKGRCVPKPQGGERGASGTGSELAGRAGAEPRLEINKRLTSPTPSSFPFLLCKLIFHLDFRNVQTYTECYLFFNINKKKITFLCIAISINEK